MIQRFVCARSSLSVEFGSFSITVETPATRGGVGTCPWHGRGNVLELWPAPLLLPYPDPISSTLAPQPSKSTQSESESVRTASAEFPADWIACSSFPISPSSTPLHATPSSPLRPRQLSLSSYYLGHTSLSHSHPPHPSRRPHQPEKRPIKKDGHSHSSLRRTRIRARARWRGQDTRGASGGVVEHEADEARAEWD